MASRKPLILIFQEIAQPTSTPVAPELRTVIVGPAYDIRDYLDDGDQTILTSVYGQLEAGPAYAPPTSSDDAVTVLDGGYPGQSPGAKVDHASVVLTLRTPRVILGSTYLSALITPVLGTGVTTSSGDRTLVTLNGVTTDFVAAGVQPGDRVVFTSSAGQMCVRTVQSIGEPDAEGLIPPGNEGLLRTTSQLPDAGAGSTEWTYDGAGEIRIERTLATQDLVDTSHTILTFPEPASDKLVIKGGATIDTVLTPRPTTAVPSPVSTTVARPLSYSELYLSYRALRQDLQRVGSAVPSDEQSVAGLPTIVGIGRVDARNPLAVGVKLALNNGGNVPIEYYGVSSNDSTGYANARARLASRGDLYCFVLLTQDIQILAAYKTAFEQQASPTYARETGVMQRFRMLLGSIPLPTAQTIYSGSISGVDQTVAAAVTNKYRTINIAYNIASAVPVSSVLPGDTVTIGLTRASVAAWQNRRGSHRVSHVNSTQTAPATASQFEITPSSSRWDDTAGAGGDDIEIVISGPDGTVRASNLAFLRSSCGAAAVAATGSITTVDGATLIDGETFTLDDGVNPATVFEFDSNGAVAPGNVAVVFTALDTDATVAAAIQAAINGVVAGLAITAGAPVVATVPLTNDAEGAYNVAITDTVAALGFLVTGMTGGTDSTLGTTTFAMLNPTTVGGPYTIDYAAGAALAITVVGFAITITVGPATTHDQVANAINTHAQLSALMTATVSLGGSLIVDDTTQSPAGPASILPGTDTAPATVIVNDALFNQLEDTTATFLSAGVKPGDRVEIPLDPNDYSPTAFTGRVLSYAVSTVLNEQRLRIANGVDDEPDVARELPHYYLRDVANRDLDNTAPNAVSYRVRRTLTEDEMVLALAAIVQGVSSRRLTVMWPDRVGVADLRDGSLTRSLPSVRTLAGLQGAEYLACAVGGVIAGTPPQMGLTGGTFVGIDRLANASDFFSEEQLARISDAGFFVCTQETEGALPECLHQLTTDPVALETGEVSVVKNIDYLSIYFQTLLKSFLGQYNNIPEALNEIYRSVQDNTNLLKGATIARIGPPLLAGEIISLEPSASAADTVEMFYSAKVPVPLNNIGFHLVVRK